MGGIINNPKDFLPDIPTDKDDWLRLRNFLLGTKKSVQDYIRNPQQPDMVQNLRVSTDTGGVILVWDISNWATEYVIYRAFDSSDFSDAKAIASISASTALVFFDPNGQKATALKRYYWVVAKNGPVYAPKSTSVTSPEVAAATGGVAVDILLPNTVTEIHLAATGTVTLLATVPNTAFSSAPVYLRNEGTAGNWLISFGGNTPGSSSYSVKLGPGDTTLVTMGEAYKEANAPIGTIKAKHDNAGAGGAGVLSGFIAWNDGTSPLVGPTGPAGSTWRNGSGAPSNGLGADGDYYLNSDNGDVYTKASGAYSITANIRGPGYLATSATSLATAGSGSKSFTTQSGLAYSVGARIRATSRGTAEYMEGVVTSYSGTTLVATMDYNSGTGTHTDWDINLAGAVGATGATGPVGPGYLATSSTSLVTAGSGSKTFTTQAGLAYSAGARIRATSTGTSEYMEGLVTSYSGTSLVVTMDRNSGTGTHTDWNINLIGDVGATGAAGSLSGLQRCFSNQTAGTTGLYISRATSASFDLGNPSKFTVRMWVRLGAPNLNNGVATRGALGSTQGDWAIGIGDGASSKPFVHIDNNAANIASSNALSLYVWHFLEFTFDSSLGSNNMKLFVDGVLDVQGTRATAITNHSNALILGTYFDNTHQFLGQISEFEFCAGVVRHTSGYTPPSTITPDGSTTVCWHLNEDGIATDSSGNGFTGSVTGTAFLPTAVRYL